MKPILVWYDDMKGDGFGRIKPSEIINTMKAVRKEALENVELVLRRKVTEMSNRLPAQRPDVTILLNSLLVDLADLMKVE